MKKRDFFAEQASNYHPRHRDVPDLTNLTISQAVKYFLTFIDGQGCSQKTYETYRQHLREFKEFARVHFRSSQVRELRAGEIARYRSYLYARPTATGRNLKPASIQLKLDSLASMFTVLMKVGAVEENPMHKIESAYTRRNRKKENSRNVLTMERARALLELPIRGRLGLRDKVIIHFLFIFGSRESELRELCWTDLEMRTLTLTRKKRNRDGRIQIPQQLHELTRQLRTEFGVGPLDPMFVGQGSQQKGLSKSGLNRIMKKYGKLVGIQDLCVRDFRTFVLSHLTEYNDPKVVQEFIGHESPGTVLEYYAKRSKKQVQKVFDTWCHKVFEEQNELRQPA